MSLNSGAQVSDRYRLLRLIATGGMGQVWEASDSVLDRHVAVKILKAEYSSDPEFVERFRSEARVTARISHPGIATVYDYGQVEDPGSGSPLSYLVMELVVGEPLSDVLAREGSLPLRHTLDMLEQTGRALHAAHAIGLVHRDVKPGNILITPTGQVKLTDFGIAKSMGASTLTQTGMVVGTAQYIAPEQAMGNDTTPAGDVYSLGVVGYECLAGRRPFVADSPVTIAMMHVRDTPPALPDTVPAPVRRLLDGALAKDPDARYPDGQAFADAVSDVRAGRNPRTPAALGAAAAAAGLAAGATAATSVLGEPGHATRQPDPTRAYTRVQPSQGPPPERTGQHPPRRAPRNAPAPANRPTAPPVSRRPSRRRNSGCAAWFLVGFLLIAVVVVVGVIALSNAGVFGPNGLFGRTTTAPTSAPQTPPAPTPPPAPAPAPQPQPTPTPEPQPTPTDEPGPGPGDTPDLEDMLDSLTAEFESYLPSPAGNAGGGNVPRPEGIRVPLGDGGTDPATGPGTGPGTGFGDVHGRGGDGT